MTAASQLDTFYGQVLTRLCPVPVLRHKMLFFFSLSAPLPTSAIRLNLTLMVPETEINQPVQKCLVKIFRWEDKARDGKRFSRRLCHISLFYCANVYGVTLTLNLPFCLPASRAREFLGAATRLGASNANLQCDSCHSLQGRQTE